MSGYEYIVGDTLTGSAGTATEVRITRSPHPEYAAVASWFFTCPGQAPLWDNYLLSIVHLRPIDDKPAFLDWPGASHEVFLVALDPADSPTTDPETWRHLNPLNFVMQVELPDDAAAVELARLCARAVVDGVLWAEPSVHGMSEPWRSSLIKTSAHLRGEEHAP